MSRTKYDEQESYWGKGNGHGLFNGTVNTLTETTEDMKTNNSTVHFMAKTRT